MFDAVARKRSPTPQKLSSASCASPPKPPPKVTYGKRNKPLPLQGTHFLRQDTYRLPPDEYDDDDDDDDEFVSVRIGTPPPKTSKEPNPGDSPLSEDELNAAYPSNATCSPILSLSSSPELPTSRSKTSLDPNRNASGAKKGIATSVRQATKKLARPHGQNVAVKNKARAAPQTRQHGTKTSVGAKHTSQVVSRPKPQGNTGTKTKAANAVRLSVNELLLVPVRSNEPLTTAARDADSDHDERNPISNTTSSGQKRILSPTHDDSDERPKAPLTTLRKRLKTPKLSHKSIAALRQKRGRRMSIFQSSDERSKLGDGFESSELKVDHRLGFAKRQRKVPKPLLLGFSALQLEPGPLPEVKFESSSTELRLGAASEEQDCQSARLEDEHDHANVGYDQPPSRDAKRRVSFSDRVLSDMVRAELSSIGAPRRPISVSSDQSESDFQEFDVSDEEVNDNEGSDNGEESDAESEHSAPAPPSNQRAQSHNRFLRKSPPPERIGKAVITDLSHDHRIGQPPRTLSSRSRMMEVDEAILDDPGAVSTTSRPLLHTDLMEVDDMILDDVDSEPPAIAVKTPICNREHDMLDEMEGSLYARSYVEPPPRPHRPRSILRNPSCRFKLRDTRPESTAANTRRNSTRQIEAESRHFPPAATSGGTSHRKPTAIALEDHEESRYFATAANMLHHPRPHATQAKIIKMRSNYFARKASERGEVQIYSSEAHVLETSPEPPDYTNRASSQLNVLRQGRDATWTSSERLPREAKDLKALTRSVSREYGTLSQSVRRRPSLPFQSPTKIR